MDSVISDMKFTIEFSEDFDSTMLPTLYFQIYLSWDLNHEHMNRNAMHSDVLVPHVKYQFFQKTMACDNISYKTSAMSSNMKNSCFSQESIRYMKKL